jgi:hypothetical protein
MQNGTRMNSNHTDHALAVGNIYFTLQPSHWLYEPIEKFEHNGKALTWSPDCIFAHNKKIYCCEVQLTDLSKAQYAKKWEIYNAYFQEAFKNGAFQDWSDKTLFPRFICISRQKKATEGFSIPNRELIVIPNIADL